MTKHSWGQDPKGHTRSPTRWVLFWRWWVLIRTKSFRVFDIDVLICILLER